jgi:hypothetical protein
MHSEVRACRTGASLGIILFTIVVMAGIGVAPRDARAQDKQIYGYLENVIISNAGLTLAAKLDTGADTSSLHAENIKRFRRAGDRFVRFQVRDENDDLITLERHLARIARIRRHDGDYQRRPVVEMFVCIGSIRRRVEVNLIDRSHLDFPFLLGRSAMEGAVVVDPERTFTTAPSCELEGMDQ